MFPNKIIPFIALLVPSFASAEIDEACADLPMPDDYDEVVQQDFLQNYFALATTLSPIHAPVPHKPGHGAIGLELLGVPPLSCEQRYVLNWSKTEETNKTPVIPRPRLTFAFPVAEDSIFVPYAGLAYVPPVTILGTRNVIISGEFGVGIDIKGPFSFSLRGHATSMKTVADVATKFTESEPDVDDLLIASTMGFDTMVGYDLGSVTPYLAVGMTDVSTVFYVGDNNVVVDNYHPYAGLTLSAGVDGLIIEKWRLGGEFYAAPGGYSLPDPDAVVVDQASRYGHIYTGRFKFGREF